MSPAPIPAIPFWFWNGDQTETLITEQLQACAAAGMRGFAVHARKGNRTPYLDGRWMELVRHACDTAADLGLEIWLYDEEDYPSGTAGWRVLHDAPELRQPTLAWTTGPAGNLSEISEPIVAFRLADPSTPVPLSELTTDEPALLFHLERNNGYVDTLNPRSCLRFMAATHEAYAAALGERIGTVVTGIYTDDVNYHMPDHAGLGWTSDVPQEFQRRYGYELLPALPALVADIGGASAVRIDFHCLLQSLFIERWVRPQAAWCKAHGVAFIGHLRGDEGPLAMSLEQYGSAMAYYREQDLPSIDDFLMRARDGAFTTRARTDHGLSPTLLYRQAASVADQFKQGRVSSEVLTSMGWSATPDEAHRHMIFQQLLGITDLTHHACYYATAGEAKRDNPPSWFVQQPWWHDHGKRIFARQARLTGWVAEGTAVVRVLVLWPTFAGFAAFRGADRRPASGLPVATSVATCDAYEEILSRLALALVRAGIPFHLADELTLAEADVVDGKLAVGRMRYDQVIQPPWQHTSTQVSTCLARAAEAGVQVHAWDGGAEASLIKRLPLALDGLGESGAIVVNLRRCDDGSLRVVLGNCGDRDLPVALNPGPGAWLIEDLANGASVHRGLLPVADLILPSNAVWRLSPSTTCASIQLAGTRWQPPAPRSLELDGWHWQPATTLVLVDGGCDDAGRWWPLRHLPTDANRPARIHHRLTLPAGTVLRGIAGEQLSERRIRLSGEPLPTPTATLPASADLALIPLTLVGPQTIELTCELGAIAGRVEDLLLVVEGMVVPQHDLSTGWQPRIVPWQDPGVGVDLAHAGLPFHWGSLTAECTVEIADPGTWQWLELGQVSATAIVTINGTVVGELDHAPWRVALDNVLRLGSNRITVTVAGTPQNCFGPHRNPRLNGSVWAPQEGTAQVPDQPYYLAPFGILGRPRLLG